MPPGSAACRRDGITTRWSTSPRSRSAGSPGQPDRRQALPPCRAEGTEHVLRVAARRDPDRDVARTADRLDLPLEHEVEPVVIPDRGQHRGVRRQGDRGQRSAIDVEAARELGCDVLRVGSAPAVAEEHQGVPGPEGLDENVRDLDHDPKLGGERRLDVDARLDPGANRLLDHVRVRQLAHDGTRHVWSPRGSKARS